MKINVEQMCLISSIMNKMEIDSKLINGLFEKGKSVNGKSNEEKEAMQKQLGAELLFMLGKKLYLVKDELIQFIASYRDIPEDEAKKVDVIEFIKEAMKDEGLKSFLKQEAMSE